MYNFSIFKPNKKTEFHITNYLLTNAYFNYEKAHFNLSPLIIPFNSCPHGSSIC